MVTGKKFETWASLSTVNTTPDLKYLGYKRDYRMKVLNYILYSVHVKVFLLCAYKLMINRIMILLLFSR